MAQGRDQGANEIDPRGVKINFSDGVREAFGDLAASVHFSEHFSPEMLSIVQDWAAGKRDSVHDVMTAFPAIAKDTFKHIQATSDERAREAWGNLGTELLERGFTLSKDRSQMQGETGTSPLPSDHRRKAAEIDPRSLEVRFSPEVRKAMRDLEAAAHFSNHFDPDMRSILKEWAAGDKKSVHGIMIAFPLIAEETFKHIDLTRDTRAEKAWSDMGSGLLESGFTLVQARGRGK